VGDVRDFKMLNKKVLIIWVPIVAVISLIIAVVIWAGYSHKRSQKAAWRKTVTQTIAQSIPRDFDWQTYIQNYEDLRRAGILTEEKAKRHWMEFGRNEGRIYHKVLANVPAPIAVSEDLLPPDFDWETYVDNYGDLQRADIRTREQAAKHWLKIGRKEGRTYKKIPYQPLTVRSDFDWQTYVNNYPDLRAAGIDTKEKAIEHWLKQGKREGRTYLKNGNRNDGTPSQPSS